MLTAKIVRASVGCLLERLQSNAVDVVVAERRKRSEPWYFRMSYFFTGYFLLTDRREYPFWKFLCTLLVRSETFCFAAVGPPARLVGSFLVTCSKPNRTTSYAFGPSVT